MQLCFTENSFCFLKDCCSSYMEGTFDTTKIGYVHVSVKAGASSPFDFEEKWQHREWKCKRMRRKKHLSNVAFAESLNIFFWQRKKPNFYRKPKRFHCSSSTIQPCWKKKSAGDASLHSEPISRQHLQNHSTISRQHLQELEARAHTHNDSLSTAWLGCWRQQERQEDEGMGNRERVYLCVLETVVA